jgi:hypothetical protein
VHIHRGTFLERDFWGTGLLFLIQLVCNKTYQFPDRFLYREKTGLLSPGAGAIIIPFPGKIFRKRF